MLRGGVWIVVVTLGCSGPASPGPASQPQPVAPAATEPAQPPATPTAEPAVVVAATEVPGDNGCDRVVVTATRGAEVVAKLAIDNECEDAPDYDCHESGDGCATSITTIEGSETLGQHTFVWLSHTASRQANDREEVSLVGYACGELRTVFEYTAADQADREHYTLEPPKDDHTRVLATFVYHDVSDEEATRRVEMVELVWNDQTCTYATQKAETLTP